MDCEHFTTMLEYEPVIISHVQIVKIINKNLSHHMDILL